MVADAIARSPMFATTSNQFPIRFTQSATTINVSSDMPAVSINQASGEKDHD